MHQLPDPSPTSASHPTVPDDLAVARAVLDTEAAGLAALAGALDAAFTDAVTRLAGAKGRVVVSGMGKSGHVGRKIAATLASTGTPAMFVHPAEASHGDLGMILPGDVVLALSNSGETAELADLVAHSRRFAIGLIGITARADSALAQAADVALILPDAPEACPNGLAPTTSTTMQIALGDALAVALLTRRGFSARDFRQFHPGGKLGARLRRVSALMHGGAAVPVTGIDTLMDRALLIMTEGRFGVVGVVDDAGRLIGVVTDGDLRRAMGPDLLTRRVGEVMTRAPRTIGEDDLAAEALHQMNLGAPPITSLFVTNGTGQPVGIVHIHDLLRAGVA